VLNKIIRVVQMKPVRVFGWTKTSRWCWWNSGSNTSPGNPSADASLECLPQHPLGPFSTASAICPEQSPNGFHLNNPHILCIKRLNMDRQRNFILHVFYIRILRELRNSFRILKDRKANQRIHSSPIKKRQNRIIINST
jgi:hypothetical protein